MIWKNNPNVPNHQPESNTLSICPSFHFHDLSLSLHGPLRDFSHRRLPSFLKMKSLIFAAGAENLRIVAPGRNRRDQRVETPSPLAWRPSGRPLAWDSSPSAWRLRDGWKKARGTW